MHSTKDGVVQLGIRRFVLKRNEILSERFEDLIRLYKKTFEKLLHVAIERAGLGRLQTRRRPDPSGLVE
jgi:hypothetical protein